ncbi:SDR family NAD(P)-dependent oxidoreductase, partial [Actinokineospora sp. PR83]|uniref:type I polyketide synthase n=1 Tax=Actinokineospora sp. PR83 TaxID=2884908 RepID=UPI0027DF6523
MADDAKVLDYLKRATADLRETRRRLAEAEGKRHEPIAVVGMSCQYPGGVRSPEDLWRLVSEGRDGIGGFPTDRGWAEDALRDVDGSGALTVAQGGFLADAGLFDAGFFGISPREALAMDPQQRLLLEHAWTAVERAGIDPRSLRGTRTGVFAGVMYHDYAVRLHGAADDVAGYVGTGSAASVVSGRVAYAMGLQGPTLTVDTACSSSLVALHLAASALRQDECRFALAGGVTVMSNAGSFVEFSRAGGLSADGRCKSFAEGADGTGFGEGVGVLLLEKLSDAQRNGHRVLAVLRGSAVNSDGASSGLTAPNGASQQRVIRQALANARLETTDIDLVEAHGTGTPLGDPIEAQAVIATYGQDRDRPVHLGSIKSNIGHTQAAAGVSGVIKAILALRHGVMPRSLHLGTPTSQVDWESGAVSLLTEARDWPEVDRPRRAAVSSFGISGTNAHIIVEQAVEAGTDGAGDPGGTDATSATAPAAGPTAWPLAGRTEDALRAQAARLKAALVAAPDWAAADIGHSLATTRTAFEHRAVVVGSTRGELLAGLDAITPAPVTRGRTAFAFTGQGSQRAGMGRGLAAAFPVFAAAWDEVVALFPAPVRHVLVEDQSRLDDTEFAQPAIFAFEVALARLFASWGVRPDVVIGHSVGEIAAAHVAGVFTLADAAALVVERGRLMGAVTARGAMAVIGLPEREITLPAGVEVAAVNSADSTVVSGDADAVAALADEHAARGVRVKRLAVSHAFHSAHMDEAVAPLAALVGSLPRSAPAIEFVPAAGPGDPADADYWTRNLRGAVRFADGAARLDAARVVEIGPDAALAPLLAECAPAQRRDRDEALTALRALGHVHATGGEVDWSALHTGGRVVDLPTYPFQRERYWPATEAPTSTPWHYRDHWTPVPENPPVALGGWLVVGAPDSPQAADLAARGARVVDAAEVPDAAGSAEGVLALHPTAESLLALLQSLVDTPVPVWAVTTGALSDAPEQAAVWGLGRTAALEIPERWGGLVDAPADTTADRLARVLGGGETEVLLTPDGNRARRLARAETAASWTPRGTVLITGGTGALGVRVAHWAAATADRLVLTSRRGGAVPDGLPAGTSVVAVDAADREAMAALLADVEPDAVIHAAGVLDDGVIDRLTPERLASVAAAKPVAVRVLDELTRDRDLDAFVVFSSAAATFGAPGQGNYAAANAELDALVRARHAAGLPGTSIAWGPWAEDGMATGDKAAARTARSGLAALTADRAVTALALAVGSGLPALTVVDIDWSVFALPGRLLSDLAPARAAAPAPDLGAQAERFRALPADRRGHALLDLVRETAAAVLGFASARAVPADRAFRELGFDSLTAVELRTALNAATGLSLPATAVFDHPTAADLARHVDGLLDGVAATRVPSVVAAAGSDEPIAIVGMACRFPGGVAAPEDLWDMLVAGRDGLGPFPDDRNWDLAALFDPDPDNPGTSYTATGGFLRDVPGFDADFFGISPREALAMDPQQRLLLETTWEAFERAGVAAPTLRGSATGVFVGTNGQDYAPLFTGSTEGVEGHLATGNSASVVSGRLSYVFGLEGPAVTVDTACSASLVALHLAVQALRSGECTLAVAGGVTVMSTPTAFIEFSRQRGLSGDGRCKAFSADADGTGWGEGVGVLVVERLSDARRHGHRVLALVRGSAVNQDGASNGLTAPHGPSQERVIRQALANARLEPSDVDMLEAHGTGTSLGDPIEAQALLATYGQGRTEPLYLGSVKSNIGHTQAAAGVAGIIKSVLALNHRTLPKTLHVDAPTPHVDWTAGSVELLTEARPWPEADRPRRAAVSSFGVSGTNAHVILEQGDPAPEQAPDTALAPLVLTARSAAALRAQARRLADALPSLPTTRAAFALATTRAHLGHRAVALGVDAVRALAAGEQHPALVQGTAGEPGRVVFVFPGQGSQWVGMARELAASSEVFAARLAECDAALSEFKDWSLDEALGDSTLLERVDVVQPVLWAVMVSLAEVWRSWGIEPAAVVGHSQGEIAAAVVAGALSLEDGARVVALRSQVLRRLAGRGGMVSVALGEAEVRARIAPFGDRVSVAAVNGPAAVVVSGEPAALDELVAECEADGVRAKRVPVDYASHSAQVDELREELLAALAPVRPRVGLVPVHSTLTGRVEDGSGMDAGYWFDNLRSTVEFAAAVTRLVDDGFGVFVECSPHPVLTMALPDDVVAVGSLKRDHGGLDRMLLSLGEAVVAGTTPDWERVLPGAEPVELPTYPFQHERFWPQRVTAAAGAPSGFGQGAAGHPFLGALVSLADGDGAVLTGRLALDDHPWLADHVVAGRLIVPGTALVELALCAGEHTRAPHVEELTLHQPLTLPEQGALRLQVSVGADQGGRRPVSVHSRPDADDAPWTRHADGHLTAAAPEAPAVAEWPAPGAVEVDIDGLYADLATRDLGYGPAFRGLRRVWRDGDDVLAEVRLDDAEHAAAQRFGLHPAVLDAALHAIALGGFVDAGVRAALPFSFSDVRLSATGATALRVRVSAAGPNAVTVTAADAEGAPVVRVGALALRPLDTAALAPATGAALYALDRVEVAHEPAAAVLDIDGLSLADVLTAVQTHLADDTAGLLTVRTTDTVDCAAARGLVRTAANENPGRLALVDTDGSLDTTPVNADEPELVVRDGRVLAPRLVRAETTAVTEPFTAESRVLITGGTGTLGLLLARHLVAEHGVRHLVLVSRSGGVVPEIDADVRVVACDVSDRDAVAALLAEHPVTAIVHAAGVLDDGVVTALTPDRLDALLAPKLTAARHLAELAGELTALVLFSSAAGVLGNPGQSGYAAANSALDALAVDLRAAGVPATSLPWGLWASASGMTGHLDGTKLRRTARALTDDDALALFSTAVRTGAAVLAPLDLDLAAVRAAGEVPPLLRALVPVRRRRAAAATAAPTADLTPAAALDLVRATTAAVLGHASAASV